MDLGLQDRKAIVTGAAMGIGRATAEALGQEGCTVAALDIDETALKELAGAIIAVPADLSSADGCSTAATAALDALGGLDILVNNVGSGAVRTFDQLTDEDWQRTFDLNFFSYLRITRGATASANAVRQVVVR